MDIVAASAKVSAKAGKIGGDLGGGTHSHLGARSPLRRVRRESVRIASVSSSNLARCLTRTPLPTYWPELDTHDRR
jgi:hypothetical protein